MKTIARGELIFTLPSIQGSYTESGKNILSQNMSVLTGDYAATFVHVVYCNPENDLEFQNIKGIIGDKWLWVFNRNLWTPEGVYVIQDIEAIGRSQPLNQNELEEMLKGGKELNWGGVRFSKDGRIRFAPKESYKLESHTPETLAKDGFVITSYGFEGAEKLGEASSRFKNNSKIWGIDIQEGQSSEQRVSAIGGDYSGRADILKICGNCYSSNKNSHAFGVLKNAA